MKKIYYYFIFILILGGCSMSGYAMNQAQSSNVGAIPASSQVLIVYCSKTGATQTMAEEIAKKYSAKMIRININSNAAPVIDMSKYQLIFLGAPIWWYKPADPLWVFVENNNFQGRRVILFNTFNAAFKETEIKRFQDLVEKKGGEFLDHIYIRRGRGSDQIGEEELKQKTDNLLNKLPQE